ncbi:hypothetical protein [Lactococcus phage PLG-II]|nr:hypothetical protein [Lactococcus phage PLG-II]
MSKPVITVKKETLDYLQNTGIARIMRDWRAWLDGTCITTDKVDEVFNNLNSAMYDSSASDIIEFYISGAYDFIPVEKEYKIIIPDVYRNGNGLHWNYLFMSLTANNEPVFDYSDIEGNIYTFPESKLKHFPKWAQELAKEAE